MTRLRTALTVLGLGAALVPLQGCGMLSQYANRGSSSSSGGGDAVLEVVNRGSRAVYSLQASSCSDSNWGRDHLGNDVIAPGATKRFTLGPGCWDLRADYDSDHSNGNERVQRGVRIGSGSSWTWTVSN